MQTTLIFDASNTGDSHLAPLTDLRPVFDVRTGALTTLERFTLHARLNDLSKPEALLVPDAHAAVAREDRKLPVYGHSEAAKLTGTVFLVNGACPLNDTDMTGIEVGAAVIDERTGMVLKAHVEAPRISAVLRGELAGLRITKLDARVMTRPWHVRSGRDACLGRDLHMLLCDRLKVPPHELPAHAHRTHISPLATVHPSAIFDHDKGSVIIDDHAVIRPGAIIVGPAFIGEHSTVLERTLIKGGSAIGPHCKVAGEVGGTIFQGFANKAHDGHLGDSWVGAWANLGAGTTNSNLLNTYGEVIARPLVLGGPALRAGSNERTGEQFLGAIIGDHVKTAICTRIMTGAIIGTGTMFAASGPLTGTVPPFSWITDAGTRTFAMEKFIEIAKTVMARRKITPSESGLALLRSIA